VTFKYFRGRLALLDADYKQVRARLLGHRMFFLFIMFALVRPKVICHLHLKAALALLARINGMFQELTD
jgi:hypothetical protein